MKWFEQHMNFQLGDFIMLTSGLKALSEMWGSPINVYFNTSVVRDLYQDCDFINTIHKRPPGVPFASSLFSSYKHGEYRAERLSKQESMQSCFFRHIAVKKGYDKPMPHTYVDRPDGLKLEREEGKKYIALFHGCLGDIFADKKTIPISSLIFLVREVLECGHIPVILGNKRDYKLYWKNVKLSDDRIINYLNKLSIRDSVSVLSQCDNFMSNDTGLYHVASALKMEGLVLWNKTSPLKNAPSYSGVTQFFGKNLQPQAYNAAISSYLKGLS